MPSSLSLDRTFVDPPSSSAGAVKFTSTNADSSCVLRGKFVFLDLFAGYAGFSRAVAEIAGDLVAVLEPLDGYHNWDIFTDEGFKQAKEAVRKADHTHCLHVQIIYKGSPKRSAWKCDGDPFGCSATWVGLPTRCSREPSCGESCALCFIIMDSGNTFSLENPWDSFAWSNPALIKVLTRSQTSTVQLN